eukprot:TRINITY_DN2778_c0_g2_i1.p1 TRINITY_DN2778_c0_g2~~TRINITY_DN2778_c0_g2_i1.p1  ORF type:complete len:131 (-),score=2.32 TRINITY_DN2778_c0_g2_i1:516-908(-)
MLENMQSKINVFRATIFRLPFFFLSTSFFFLVNFFFSLSFSLCKQGREPTPYKSDLLPPKKRSDMALFAVMYCAGGNSCLSFVLFLVFKNHASFTSPPRKGIRGEEMYGRLVNFLFFLKSANFERGKRGE